MTSTNRKFRWTTPLLLILVTTGPTQLGAHELGSLNGQKPAHQHVYKRTTYGKGVTTGHYAKPAGSNGIVIWSSTPSSNYGKTLPDFKVPRSQSKPHSQEDLFDKDRDRTPDLDRR